MRLTFFYRSLFIAASAVAGSSGAAALTKGGSGILQKPDLLGIKTKSKSYSSPVIVKRGFLTPFQTHSIRRNENRYEHQLVPDGIIGGAYITQSFMRRLVEVGGEQCPSDEYENNLPSGVHIFTHRFDRTTDPHVDVNPMTREPVTNDVGVVFLNTNEGAKLVIRDEMIDVEEGTLVIFPGGLVHHHIEMMKGGSGFVHLLGPFEVGGSHGFVGRLGGILNDSPPSIKRSQKSAHANFHSQKQNRQLEGGEVKNSSNAVTGDIFVTGYTNGTDQDGAENHTLLVEWNLGGLYTDCGMGSCFHVEIKDDPTFCDNVAIGQLKSDVHESESESEEESDDGNHVILKNISHTVVTQGESFINIKKPIEHLLNFPAVVHGHDGAVLGCDILTEIIVEANETDTAAIAVDGTSGANSISFGWVLALIVGTVASLVAL